MVIARRTLGEVSVGRSLSTLALLNYLYLVA